jgi:predicted MFS family arabinose efflux permease
VVGALTAAAGIAVANNYFAQPLAPDIAATFHVSSRAFGTVLSLVQLSYAVGIAFLVPLADLVDGRRLVVRMLAVTTVGQLLAAFSPGLVVFATAGVAVALTTAVAQVIVGVSGRAVPGGRTGATVGRVAMGLILGMVLSRRSRRSGPPPSAGAQYSRSAPC